MAIIFANYHTMWYNNLGLDTPIPVVEFRTHNCFTFSSSQRRDSGSKWQHRFTEEVCHPRSPRLAEVVIGLIRGSGHHSGLRASRYIECFRGLFARQRSLLGQAGSAGPMERQKTTPPEEELTGQLVWPRAKARGLILLLSAAARIRSLKVIKNQSDCLDFLAAWMAL